MRHAVLIMGNSNPDGVSYVVNQLKDPDIEFFLHWDKSSQIDIRKYLTQNSLNEINVIEPVHVSWGSSTLVNAQLDLFEAAHKSKFDYYHLISDKDVALMDPEYFKKFFENSDKEYVGFSKNMKKIDERLKYYYPFENFDISKRKKEFLDKLLCNIQKFFKVNRLKNMFIEIKKGENWCSLTDAAVSALIDRRDFFENVLKNTTKSDELYIQTVLWNSDVFQEKMNDCLDEHDASLRYIDWNRGQPYEFTDNNYDEISQVFNTKYAFIRKISIDNNPGLKKLLRTH